MPQKFLSKIDKIVYIICGKVNISQPIIGITGFLKQIFIYNDTSKLMSLFYFTLYTFTLY